MRIFFPLSRGYSLETARPIEDNLYLIAYCYFDSILFVLLIYVISKTMVVRFNKTNQMHNNPVIKDELNGCGHSGTAINKI